VRLGLERRDHVVDRVVLGGELLHLGRYREMQGDIGRYREK